MKLDIYGTPVHLDRKTSCVPYPIDFYHKGYHVRLQKETVAISDENGQVARIQNIDNRMLQHADAKRLADKQVLWIDQMLWQQQYMFRFEETKNDSIFEDSS